MQGQKVLVTTAHRGVFFGELSEENGKTAELRNARNVVYWAPECRGFLGLASKGPVGNSRVGPSVSKIKLRGVTSVTECSEEAVNLFETGPWS